jgi:hypothetical protein
MKHLITHPLGSVAAVILCVVLFGLTEVLAQKSKTLTINAVAMGTSTQLGRIVNVDIHISDSSTAEDQKALLEAFGEKGSEGLVNALEKMRSKGRIAITGTLGFDLKYIRLFTMSDGSLNIRFVTDRPVRFVERWASSRSTDYSLAMGEIFIKKEKGKHSGTLVPAARLTLNKAGELELEALQNPWNLNNIRVSQ